MRRLVSWGWELIRSEDGPTAVEYAVMLALIIVVCFIAIGALGQTTNNSFNSTTSAFS
jgi:pilus assembly protein Flp/PilA